MVLLVGAVRRQSELRRRHRRNQNAGDPNVWTYVPDDSVKGVFADAGERQRPPDLAGDAKNKFSVFYDDQWRCWCKRTLRNISPEAASTYDFPIENLGSFTLVVAADQPAADRASVSHRGERFAVDQPPPSDVYRTLIPVTEQADRTAVSGRRHGRRRRSHSSPTRRRRRTRRRR